MGAIQFSIALLLILHPAFSQTIPSYIGYSGYQIVTDFSFDADQYFAKMRESGVNLQRIWVLGYSNGADEIAETMPFARVGKKYDLKTLNPAYLKRLDLVLREARQHNQEVMLTLFDHWSLATADVFPKTPWFYKNNTDHLLRKPFPKFYDLHDRRLRTIQNDLVNEIVRVAAKYSPIYEIMNEAGSADCATLQRWHKQIADWIRESDPDARIAVNIRNSCDNVINQEWVDVVSFHGDEWQRAGICKLAERYNDRKTVIIDTDGAWKVRHDNGLVRDWLKQTLSCGASFNHKDDIYNLDREALSIFKQARE